MEWEAEGFNIQTRSVEKALIPLIAQIGVVVNNNIKRNIDRDARYTLDISLPNLKLAICKFTDIGHETGNLEAEVKDEMLEVCDNTSRACNKLVNVLNNNTVNTHQLSEAAKQLLTSITKTLILVDRVATKKMVASIEKVDERLGELEGAVNFAQFVQAFSQFGGNMVELAKISGERQNDLKDELQRAEVCASRATLEKSTLMLLTTCKTCLRHPDSELATGNRASVFRCMRNSMKTLRTTVENNHTPDSTLIQGVGIDYMQIMERLHENMNSVNPNSLSHLLDLLDNVNIDMCDVINVSEIHVNKEKLKGVIELSKQQKNELSGMLTTGQRVDPTRLRNVLTEIMKTFKDMRRQLMECAQEQLSVVLKEDNHKKSLVSLKQDALQGNTEERDYTTLTLFCQKIQEISKLIKNISTSPPCILTASRFEENIINLLPQMRDAAKMLAGHPLSKITQENLEVFVDVFATQLDELARHLSKILEAELNGQSADWMNVYTSMASWGRNAPWYRPYQ